MTTETVDVEAPTAPAPLTQALRDLVGLVHRAGSEPDERLVPILYAVAEIPMGARGEDAAVAEVVRRAGILSDPLSALAGPPGPGERPIRPGERLDDYLLLQFANPVAIIHMLALDEPEDMDGLRDLALDYRVPVSEKPKRATAMHPMAAYLLNQTLWGGEHYGDVGRFYLRSAPHSAPGQTEVIDKQTNTVLLRGVDASTMYYASVALNENDNLGKMLASSWAYAHSLKEQNLAALAEVHHRIHAQIEAGVMARAAQVAAAFEQARPAGH